MVWRSTNFSTPEAAFDIFFFLKKKLKKKRQNYQIIYQHGETKQVFFQMTVRAAELTCVVQKYFYADMKFYHMYISSLPK
jgi:hypothetical protein